MDLINPEAVLKITGRRAKDQPRRDTINISHKPRPEDKDFHGHAPRPLPEKDRNWRPADFRL
jgi:hypothetical protein